MNSETVLIVEDHDVLLRGLQDNFQMEGYTVQTASDGELGLKKALDSSLDLIILDIMLPKVNGYEICRRLREEQINTPVIMLTAKGQESDILLGLNLGADDYVTKPFSIKELLARANALLRRRRAEVSETIVFGDCVLDLSADRLTRDGTEVPLTPKESSLLKYLAANAGRALTREQIMNRVWGYGVFVTPRSIDRCITTLRKKIEPTPDRPRFIQTIREIGYRFEM